MRELHAGVIGYGFMGKTHTHSYKTIPLYYSNLPFTVRLEGICDTTPHVAEEARDMQGYAYATTDPMQIINDPKIDVVSICTPNVFHKDLVLAALKAGKHVYCDKPLTANAAESREILDVLPNYPHQTTQVALQMRFYPAVMRAKQLIEEGRLGKIFLYQCDYLHSSGIDPNKPLSWKQNRSFGGGGVLLDLGAHAYDVMYYLLGEYQNVYTITDIVYPQRPDGKGSIVNVEAEDTAITLAAMKSGCTGKILVSKVATGMMDELRFDIHGEKGALSFSTMNPGYLRFYDATRPEQPLGGEAGFTWIDCHQKYPEPGGHFPNPRFAIGFLRAHAGSMYNFLENVAAGRQSSPSFAESAYIQQVMESCYQSQAENRWVNMEGDTKHD
ncbi:MAG: Gfo/Idh/MocA family oxidoreductase [Candidatus Limiplasma sp.]|nr:Gfo/Idh/MocA family oxidoreductase [Candidatus Limiplasma sp.]